MTWRNKYSREEYEAMPEYQQQALDFLKYSHVYLDITYLGKVRPEWDKNNLHDNYEFSFKKSSYGDVIYRGTFCDSLINTQQKTTNKRRKYGYGMEYDILSALEVFNGSFFDFCDEFGYDNDSISAYKLYQSVLEESRGLRKVFTPEQLEKLSEIV